MMAEVVAPIARFIHLFATAARGRGAIMDEHAELMERMKRCNDMDEVLSLVPQLDAIEQRMEEAAAPIAFASKANQQQQ